MTWFIRVWLSCNPFIQQSCIAFIWQRRSYDRLQKALDSILLIRRMAQVFKKKNPIHYFHDSHLGSPRLRITWKLVDVSSPAALMLDGLNCILSYPGSILWNKEADGQGGPSRSSLTTMVGDTIYTRLSLIFLIMKLIRHQLQCFLISGCVFVCSQQDFSKQQITHCQASTEQGMIEQFTLRIWCL